MAGGDSSVSPQQPAGDTDGEREAERNEREERRGLEARAGTLLAAGAAVVGLVATAIGNISIHGAERDGLLALIACASALMLISLVMVASALYRGMTRQGKREPLATYVERIRGNNERMVSWLRWATLVFAGSVAFFLASVIWTAYASAPAAKPTVVNGERGPAGPRGPRGARGPAASFTHIPSHRRPWDPPRW